MDQDKELMIKNALPKGTILNSGKIEYRIEDVLGAGGFGITYRASAIINIGHISKRFDFAVKEHFTKGCYRGEDKISVLYPDTLKNEVEESRVDFETEAKRLSELGKLSRHIVKVNESFRANGTFYYVMEYLEGGDLEKYVRKHKSTLSEADAISLLIPIAKAVALLHSGDKPLLHLDIKPDNIVMKREDGSDLQIPVLIDFGAAKHFDKKGKPTSMPTAKGATEGFAPIEQYGPITEFDARLDVYALGATLFYLLTGKRPPKAFDIMNTSIAELLPPTITPRTRDAIVAAMKPSKNERTPNVNAFIEQIEQLEKLPLYYELKTPNSNYTIMEVLESGENLISYKAVKTKVEQNDKNATTINVVYTIKEYFNKKSCRRKEDYSVAGITDAPGKYQEFIDGIKSEAQLFSITEKNTDSNLVRNADGSLKYEIFFGNGTCYLISSNTKSRITKPKAEINFNLAKYLKYAGLFLGIAVVAFIAVKLISGTFTSQSVDEKIETPYEKGKAYFAEGDLFNATKEFMNEKSQEYADSAQIMIKNVVSTVGTKEINTIKNILSNSTLKGDIAQLRIAGENYAKLQQLKSDYATIGQTLDFSSVEKLIEDEIKAWKSAADVNPLDDVKILCYENVLALRPDSEIQKKLEQLKSK